MDECRFVVISGCSGGGKSALLAELGRRDYPLVEEPGRRTVMEELASGGSALPWVDMAAFARRVMAMALDDLDVIKSNQGWVFFDRGMVDAEACLESIAGSQPRSIPREPLVYYRRVFLAPPWPEIYVQDEKRRHSFGEAVAEYNRLLDAYQRRGYEVSVLPKVSVVERANFVIESLQG